MTHFFFLVIIVTIALLMTTSSSSVVTLVESKKEILLPEPIKEAIPLIRCSICEHTMFQIVRNTLDYISDYEVKTKLKEEKLIDRVFDPVCTPLRTGGAWLRGADWEIKNTKTNAIISSLDELSGDNTAFEFKLRGTNEKGFKCGPRCATAAAACDLIMRTSGSSDDVLGKIASILIQNFPKLLKAVQKEELDEKSNENLDLDAPPVEGDPEKDMVELAKTLVVQICRKKSRISGCISTNPKKKAAAKSSSSSQMKITPSVLYAESLEEMEMKEVEVEEMMFRMKYGFKDNNNNKNKDSSSSSTRNRRTAGRNSAADDDDEDGSGQVGTPGLDVYGRDEMMKLREALKKGDRETLKELDPQSEELSDEEFEMLAGMHQKEFGEGK